MKANAAVGRYIGADAAGRAGLVRTFNKRRTNSWPNKSKRVNGAIHPLWSNKNRDVRCQGQRRGPKDKHGEGQVERHIKGAVTEGLLDYK